MKYLITFLKFFLMAMGAALYLAAFLGAFFVAVNLAKAGHLIYAILFLVFSVAFSLTIYVHVSGVKGP